MFCTSSFADKRSVLFVLLWFLDIMFTWEAYQKLWVHNRSNHYLGSRISHIVRLSGCCVFAVCCVSLRRSTRSFTTKWAAGKEGTTKLESCTFSKKMAKAIRVWRSYGEELRRERLIESYSKHCIIGADRGADGKLTGAEMAAEDWNWSLLGVKKITCVITSPLLFLNCRMPVLFHKIPHIGRLLGVLFFLCLSLAGVSSLVATLELAVHNVEDMKGAL